MSAAGYIRSRLARLGFWRHSDVVSAPHVRRWSAGAKYWTHEPDTGEILSGPVPHFPVDLLAKFREILQRLPNGASFLLEGDAIWEFRVLPGFDHVIKRRTQPLSKEAIVSGVSGEVQQDHFQTVSNDAPSGVDGIPGHALPFVVILLPVEEAYARFPEISRPHRRRDFK